jgi:hypothetical protein
LLARAQQLPEKDQYRLIELLDPEITHFEWFLARPPISPVTWEDDAALLAAIPSRNPCMEGWPSRNIFDHNYQIISLEPLEFAVLQACDPQNLGNADPFPVTVADLVNQVGASLELVRQLQQRQLLLLQPAP